MIDVQTLWLRVNEDLARKNKSGFTSNDEFNREVNEAQLDLMNYYHRLFEDTNHLSDAVGPFIKSSTLPVVSQMVTYPTDYRHLISLRVDYINNTTCGAEPTEQPIKSDRVRAAEIDTRLESFILRPDLKKKVVMHSFINGAIKVWPRVNEVIVTYLRKPATATRGVTLDTVNDLETYSSGTTTHLEWPEQEQSNFVDLLLLSKGLAVKETALIQWAAQKNQILKQAIL